MTDPLPVDKLIIHVSEIPALTTAEALELERIELERFIELLEGLPLEAWNERIGSGDWTVKAVAAHVAGTYAAQGSFGQLRRQIDPRVIRMYRTRGQSLAETLSRIHAGDRIGHSPGEIIEELKLQAPRALRLRSLLFRPLQPVRVDFASARIPRLSLGPFAAIRDLWFHRLDISEAAGIGFGLREEHDGRFIALLLRGAKDTAIEVLDDRTVEVIVTGMGEQHVRFGLCETPDAVIEIDPIALAKLAARRRSPAATRERSQITGEVKIAMRLLTAIHSG